MVVLFLRLMSIERNLTNVKKEGNQMLKYCKKTTTLDWNDGIYSVGCV